MLPMTAPGNSNASLRFERVEFSRLGWAFAVSLALHLACWGIYSGGKKLGVWEKMHLPAWVQRLTQPLAKILKTEPKPLFQEQEPPLMFVNVNPVTATPEPPEKAKFYSNRNSKAANPDPANENDPKLSGAQEFVPETETTPKNSFDRLRPVAPEATPQTPEGPKPKPKQSPGDLALAKPETNPNTEDKEPQKERPRRLSQVDPSKLNRPPSQMMKQKGGVRAQLDAPSLDTKSTVTGNYDWLFIQAVKSRWLDLLAERDYQAADGYVRLRFKLHYDGRITDMSVQENKVSETLCLLCQKAVLDPAPFDKWTTEMRRTIANEYRDITFTFIYY